MSESLTKREDMKLIGAAAVLPSLPATRRYISFAEQSVC